MREQLQSLGLAIHNYSQPTASFAASHQSPRVLGTTVAWKFAMGMTLSRLFALTRSKVLLFNSLNYILKTSDVGNQPWSRRR